MQAYPAYRMARRELDRLLATDVRHAWRQHRNVRAAAAELGMPRSTFFDVAQSIGLRTTPKRRRRA